MAKSIFDKNWIIKNGIPIVQSYNGNLTIRSLHYRLVSKGMTNDINHYKKVVSAMTDARWEGLLDFESFQDHERETLGSTDYETTNVDDAVSKAKGQIRAWATSYSKNRWENQPIVPEVFIEKKALQGVFERPCREWDVALNPCKGYPSLTFLNDVSKRLQSIMDEGKEPIILYFGDYDCSGEDIPRSIQENLEKMGTYVEVRRIALMEHQVIEWKLPPAPTKETDSRGRNWDGLGQVELDAVEPSQIVRLCNDAIKSVFDPELYVELQNQEDTEKYEFRAILRRDFDSLM